MGRHATQDIKEHPERKEGYDRLLGYNLASYLPLLLAGLMLLTGFASSLDEFLLVGPPSKATLAFHASITLTIGTQLSFVWFRGGLRLMVTHPAMFALPKSEFGMKVFWSAMSGFAAIIVGLMLITDVWFFLN